MEPNQHPILHGTATTEAGVDLAALRSHLTQQEADCTEHYVDCLNQTEAARRAGYNGDDRTLAVTGHRVLRRPRVQAYMRALMADAAMPAIEVLARLTIRASASMEDFLALGDDGLATVDLQQAHARGQLLNAKAIEITEIQLPDGGGTKRTVKIKVHDQMPALRELAKIHHLVGAKDDDEDTGESQLRRQMRRVQERLGALQRDQGDVHLHYHEGPSS